MNLYNKNSMLNDGERSNRKLGNFNPNFLALHLALVKNFDYL